MIKYRTEKYEQKITEVEVERESPKCIWINGYKWNKRGDWHNYFDTREEAKQYLIDRETKKIEQLKASLQQARSALGQAESL